MSNGRALEEAAIIAENAAAANGDSRGLALLNIPAGNVKAVAIQWKFRTFQNGLLILIDDQLMLCLK